MVWIWHPTASWAGTGDALATTVTSAVATGEASTAHLPSSRETGLIIAPSAASADQAVKPLFDSATMMRVDDVRPGMKGYGLSVFSGIRPEKFEAEVVGVRHRVFPGQDIILCKLSSPYLLDIGVIAGMSGSPVYMEDKLIGAVAYGWTNSKEPLAGVTPIESMLEVFGSTPAEPGSGQPSRDTGGNLQAYSAYLEMRRTLSLKSLMESPGASSFSFMASELSGLRGSPAGEPETVTMQPLATPLFVSSSSPVTLGILEKLFAGMNVQAVAGGVSGGAAPSARSLNSPGGPVDNLQALADELAGGYGLAVPMIEGDLNMAGVGTVTWRKGSRLIAFGHPMFQFGSVSFPMAPARVNALVRSSVRPFKVGEPLGQIGAIRQDRLPAIGAVFGESVPMIPVHATVDDAKYQGRRDFSFRVMADRDLAPGFAMSAIGEAIAAAGRAGGDTAALFRYSAAFDDGTTITREDYLADDSGGVTAAFAVGSDVGVMMTNPFKRVTATDVAFTIRLADKLPQARIVSASLDRDFYRPGDTVRATWELQPYRREPVRMAFEFPLPGNLPDNDYALSISDAATRMATESSRNPGAERIIDYASLVRALKRNFPANKVFLTVQDRDTGAAVRGEEMPKLPGSVIGTLESSTNSPYYAPVRGNLLVDADVATEYEVGGAESLAVRVTRGKN
jgi:hypothetical protein